LPKIAREWRVGEIFACTLERLLGILAMASSRMESKRIMMMAISIQQHAHRQHGNKWMIMGPLPNWFRIFELR